MASASGFTLNEPSIPLISKIKEEDIRYVTLSRTVTIGQANSKKSKAELIQIENGGHVKLLLCAILEFHDACCPERLSLTSGPNLYTYFRQILSGNVRDDFDVIRPTHDNTVAGFNDAIAEFISQFVKPTDLADQRHYLETTKKPFKLSCQSLAGRLKVVNKLMSCFPGAQGVPPLSDDDIKRIFYNLMLEDWKLSFLTLGHDLLSNAYTFTMLVRQFELLENAFNRKRSREHERKSSSNSQSCLGQHGGRGGGRYQHSYERLSQRRRTDSYYNNNSNNNNDSRGISGDCPFHPGQHNWSQCFGNPRGNNYCPNFQLRPPAIRHGGRGYGRGNGRGGGRGGGYQGNGSRIGNSRSTDSHVLNQSNRSDSTNVTSDSSRVQNDGHWMDSIGSHAEW